MAPVAFQAVAIIQGGWHDAAMRLAFVVTAALLVTTCGGDSPSAEMSTLLPPGSELGEDFMVPAGTSLLGSRFAGQQDGAWRALLLVDGDPFEIIADLVRQTNTSGLNAVTPHTNGLACTVHLDTLLECDLYADGEDPPRTYMFALRWGSNDGASYRHVLVTRDPQTYASMPEVSDFGSDPTRTPTIALPRAPEVPEAWDPPAVGDSVAETPSWFGETVVTREAGSTVVAPPGPAECITGGYTAVLRLDEDADASEVVGRYAEQFEMLGFDGETSEGSLEGRPVVAARHSAAGGGELEAVALGGAGDEPALLLLWRCND
jgi:hypothetical protein